MLPAGARTEAFDRVFFSGCALLALVAGAGLALWFAPEPHSDWAYYWKAAGEPGLYRRGGVGLWLLAIPKALGLGPVGASLVLNLAAASAFVLMARAADPGPLRWRAALAVCYLLLLVPFFGIVQLDVVAAVLLGAGMLVAFRAEAGAGATTSRRLAVRRLVATGLVAAAVSTKPQYALVLWAFLVLVPFVAFVSRRWRSMPRGMLVVLFAGSLAGFGADYALRAIDGNTTSMRTSSAVTLYGGLLVSDAGPGCGYWSVEAAEAAKEDLHKPLPVAIRDRLAARPLDHWASVVRCKLPQILRPPPFALYWLVESPNIRARIDAHPGRDLIERQYRRALEIERRAYATISALVLLLAGAGALAAFRRRAPFAAVLPLAWIVAFWLVHLVFEIQGRYFLGMFLLVPFLSSFLSRPWQGRAAPSPQAANQLGEPA